MVVEFDRQTHPIPHTLSSSQQPFSNQFQSFQYSYLSQSAIAYHQSDVHFDSQSQHDVNHWVETDQIKTLQEQFNLHKRIPTVKKSGKGKLNCGWNLGKQEQRRIGNAEEQHCGKSMRGKVNRRIWRFSELHHLTNYNEYSSEKMVSREDNSNEDGDGNRYSFYAQSSNSSELKNKIGISPSNRFFNSSPSPNNHLTSSTKKTSSKLSKHHAQKLPSDAEPFTSQHRVYPKPALNLTKMVCYDQHLQTTNQRKSIQSPSQTKQKSTVHLNYFRKNQVLNDNLNKIKKENCQLKNFMEKTKNDHRFHQESKKNNQLKQQRRGLTQKNNQKKSTNIGMKNQFRSNNQKEKTLLKIIKQLKYLNIEIKKANRNIVKLSQKNQKNMNIVIKYSKNWS